MEFIRVNEFERVRKSSLPTTEKLELLATMCRLNTLVSVKKAGSGHLGSSFSAMDIASFMYFHHMNLAADYKSEDRDIYFSSKGHDVPGQYSVLYALGIVPEDRYLKLRRLGGLDGHPDIKVPGIEANTGSLGMGISKARGIAVAKKLKGKCGRVFVMTGDGEFQEGQNFEALQSTVQQKVSNIVVIMDHNKLQSDRLIDRIVSLGDLEKKIASFGWHVARIDGHDYNALIKTFADFEKVTDKPKFLICDTIKGRGVSFMEHPRALSENNGFYRWHAGAPDDASFEKAYAELRKNVEDKAVKAGIASITFTQIEMPPKVASGVSSQFLAAEYGKSLVQWGHQKKDFVVLDADLSLDCKLREFEDTFTDRFIECGIAEQDMVSMGAGFALHGITPVINSFANFLAARANEQIYNMNSEGKKALYACHYAGLLPAGPGKSHQSVRDISLFGAFPKMAIVHPGTAQDVSDLVSYFFNDHEGPMMMRLPIGPSPRIIETPTKNKLVPGCGYSLTKGSENVMFAYGPVMLAEALEASEALAKNGIELKVVNMPWLNKFDKKWLTNELKDAKRVYVLEDHSVVGGLGDRMMAFLNENTDVLKKVYLSVIGTTEIPACGTPKEALGYHRMDAMSLATRVHETQNR